MRRFFKWLTAVILLLAIGFAGYALWPYIDAFVFRNTTSHWVSEKLSEELRAQNKLVVYEVKTEGQDTVTTDAWLLGTVQKVVIPYSFQMSYTVDLSAAAVSIEKTDIEVRIPSPVPGYQKLTVDDAAMEKVDWLHPLTAERYAKLKLELENRLFDEYSVNSENRQSAWEAAVADIEQLFSAFTQENPTTKVYSLRVICDDTLSSL